MILRMLWDSQADGNSNCLIRGLYSDDVSLTLFAGIVSRFLGRRGNEWLCQQNATVISLINAPIFVSLNRIIVQTACWPT
jgi:hypothetical protein